MEKAHEICLEMFTQRGYIIQDYDDDKITAIKQDGKIICAFMANAHKFNTMLVREYISLITKHSVDHCVIVYNDLTSAAKKIIDILPDIVIELFNYRDLQYNITKHILVPKHERLDLDEAEKFKKTYGIKIPVIFKSDPVSKFYAYQRGDIIKITRSDGYVTYRIVKNC